jgi:carboxylesterase
MPPWLIIPTAEPFFFTGGKTGCLLVHGFTGTPKEMRWMGEFLAAQGYTVLGIRLAGHATDPHDLPRTQWQDWLASVEDGIRLLQNTCEQIFIIGLSMGGVLALTAATRYPVAGVITMSTLYALPSDPRLPFLRLLSWFKPEISKGPPDWHNLAAEKDHISYPAYSTRGMAELNDLLSEMRSCLHEIKVPVLLFHSCQDKGVPGENMQKIFNDLCTIQKEMVWLENSGHIIPREPDRYLVFKKTHEFINQITGISHVDKYRNIYFRSNS